MTQGLTRQCCDEPSQWWEFLLLFTLQTWLADRLTGPACLATYTLAFYLAYSRYNYLVFFAGWTRGEVARSIAWLMLDAGLFN